MISEIVKEKISADHLLYVSLKYTKTCDVILNLLARWKSLLELSFDSIISIYVENGKIPGIPNSPKQRLEFVKKYFAKYNGVQEGVKLYIFFKRVPDLPKAREGEFRKNVNLKVTLPTEVVHINLQKLDEYAAQMDEFVNEIKKILD